MRHIMLEQFAELLRIKRLPVRFTEFDGGQKILTQLRLRVFDKASELPRIRRVQQPRQALTPCDDEYN